MKTLWITLSFSLTLSMVVASHEARGCDAHVVAPQVLVQPQVAAPTLFYSPTVTVVPTVVPSAVYVPAVSTVAVQSLAIPTVVQQKIVVRQARPVVSVQRTFTRTRSR